MLPLPCLPPCISHGPLDGLSANDRALGREHDPLHDPDWYPYPKHLSYELLVVESLGRYWPCHQGNLQRRVPPASESQMPPLPHAPVSAPGALRCPSSQEQSSVHKPLLIPLREPLLTFGSFFATQTNGLL